MKLDGSFQERLERWLSPDHWTLMEGTVLVSETAGEGSAEITFQLPSGMRCVFWRVGEKYVILPLLKQKAADGMFQLELPDGTWEGHVVECKKTIGEKAWQKALEQMRWSLARLRAINGVPGLTLSRVVCHTAYRTERVSPARAVDMIDFKSGVEAPPDRAPTPPELLRLLEQWSNGRVRLEGHADEVEHRRIQLHEMTGEALVFVAPYA